MNQLCELCFPSCFLLAEINKTAFGDPFVNCFFLESKSKIWTTKIVDAVTYPAPLSTDSRTQRGKKRINHWAGWSTSTKCLLDREATKLLFYYYVCKSYFMKSEIKVLYNSVDFLSTFILFIKRLRVYGMHWTFRELLASSATAEPRGHSVLKQSVQKIRGENHIDIIISFLWRYINSLRLIDHDDQLLSNNPLCWPQCNTFTNYFLMPGLF